MKTRVRPRRCTRRINYVYKTEVTSWKRRNVSMSQVKDVMRNLLISGAKKRVDFARILSAALLASVVLMICFSPRLDVPFLSQLFGRNADLRLQDLWLVPALLTAVLIAVNSKQIIRSPWSPWLLKTFTLLSMVSILALLTSSSLAFSQLGYAARFFQFFVFVFVIAVLRTRAGAAGDVVALATLSIGFILNAFNALKMQLYGEVATYTSALTGDGVFFYGPSMLNEPNSLSSGLFFVAAVALLSGLYLSKRIRSEIYVASVTVLSAIIVVVGDRSSLVACIAVLLFMTACKFSPAVTTFTFLILIGLWFGIARLADMGVGPWRFQSRFLWESFEGRSLLWLDNLSLVLDRPFIGWGPGGATAANNFVGLSEAHNAYVRVLQEYGLLGTVILGIFVLLLLKRQPLSLPLRNLEPKYLPFNFLWVFTIKAYLVALLVAGLLTDSFTTTVSWHLLAVFAGLTWGSTISQSLKSHGGFKWTAQRFLRVSLEASYS
jgi:O-antigen ligase